MKSKAGFTLMELVVVIAVITILTMIAVPSIASLRQHYGVSGTLRDILLMLRQARLVAVEENETVVVKLNVASGTYMAFVDDGGSDLTDVKGPFADFPDGVPDQAQNGIKNNGERIVMEGTVPNGVHITAANFTGAAEFSYDNRGFPINAAGVLTDGTITLTTDQGGSHQIDLLRNGHSVIQ
jgi:type IV fimbrial biogenesis protein FimT